MARASFLEQQFTDVEYTSIGSKTKGLNYITSSITVRRNENNQASLDALLREYDDAHVSFSELADADTYLFHHSTDHYLLIIKR